MPTAVKFFDRRSHLSVVFTIELEGINNQLKLIVLQPVLEVGPGAGDLRVDQTPVGKYSFVWVDWRLDDLSTKVK